MTGSTISFAFGRCPSQLIMLYDIYPEDYSDYPPSCSRLPVTYALNAKLWKEKPLHSQPLSFNF